jgi:hypothetical protein
VDGSLVGSVVLLIVLGAFFAASGWYYYRGRRAGRLKDQPVFQMFPGAACAIPVCGAGCFGLAITLLAPQPVKVPFLVMSLLAILAALILIGWCPRRWLPMWLREPKGS